MPNCFTDDTRDFGDCEHTRLLILVINTCLRCTAVLAHAFVETKKICFCSHEAGSLAHFLLNGRSQTGASVAPTLHHEPSIMLNWRDWSFEGTRTRIAWRTSDHQQVTDARNRMHTFGCRLPKPNPKPLVPSAAFAAARVEGQENDGAKSSMQAPWRPTNAEVWE